MIERLDFHMSGLLLLIALTGCDRFEAMAAGQRIAAAGGSAVAPSPSATAMAGPPAIEVTPRAQAQLIRILADAGETIRPQVRLKIIAGGCKGTYYDLKFVTAPLSPDEILQSSGQVDCVYSREQFPFLQGTVLDFERRDGQEGFTFERTKQTDENRRLTDEWIRSSWEAIRATEDEPE
jgi:iron-sulfur cluster assembly accessory protein